MTYSGKNISEICHLNKVDSSRPGEMYLEMMARAWHTSDRKEQLEQALWMIVDSELYYAIEDVCDSFVDDPEPWVIELAEETLAVFKRRTVRHLMKKLTRRVRTPTSRGWYQGVHMSDLKLVVVLAYIFDLQERALEVIDEALVSADEPPRLPPPD